MVRYLEHQLGVCVIDMALECDKGTIPLSHPAWLLERQYRLSKMSFVGRIVSTAAQVVAGWAAPLFALGGQRLSGGDPFCCASNVA